MAKDTKLTNSDLFAPQEKIVAKGEKVLFLDHRWSTSSKQGKRPSARPKAFYSRVDRCKVLTILFDLIRLQPL